MVSATPDLCDCGYLPGLRRVHIAPTLTLRMYLGGWLHQWRRCVIKSGGQGQSGQAIKLFQITCDVSDFQTFNNPGS